MCPEPEQARSPLDAFLAAFKADVDGGGVRPLSEYLARFRGDDAGIAREYLANEDRMSGASGASGGGSGRIGHYVIIRQIGRGGQGTVYLAEGAKPRRHVALKVMDPGFAANPGAVERFHREADIASKLDHPGICTVYETGESGSKLWISMRYIEGESLAKKVASAKGRHVGESKTTVALPEGGGAVTRSTPTTVALGPPGGSADDPPTRPALRVGGGEPSTWDEISGLLRLFEDAARALHAAHEAGVVHRDVKPGNIMVTEDGRPIILDFGLAQDVERDLPTLTQTGDLLGTPAYMSPEQIAAAGMRLDRRTDVYSLGVSLFECLTLRRPFEAPTREGLCEAILRRPPPDLRHLNAAVSSDLRVVVATAIEKERDRRYQTALHFAEELRRVRMREPIVAKPVGMIVRLARWGQRNPALAASVAALFLALTAGLAVALALLGKVTAERNDKEDARASFAASVADYDRLGDLSRLQALRAEADKLWPCEPSKAAAMKAWLAPAADLERRLPEHRAVLERLRALALPISDADKAAAAAAAAAAPDAETSDSNGDARVRPPARRFASTADQFKHDTIAILVAELAAFADPDPHKGLIADVRARLAFAESVERETIAKHRDRWARAAESIAANPRYRGLKVAPQLGLIPVGEDPKSHLWEFVHFQTVAPGADPIPKRDEGGRLVVTEDMGIVFVLLPAGAFAMGAGRRSAEDDALVEEEEPGKQAASATGPNVDPEANDNEGPVVGVDLEPFFLSKYEMTQGQWLRLAGKNPSEYRPGGGPGGMSIDLRHPVEQVTWNECDLWLGRLGLALPTEAQWEYAARGGTTIPRWTGPGTEGLAQAANLADQCCKQNSGPPTWKYEPWDDGYPTHGPTGAFAPNPFGLHDVLGNVWEWCRDRFANYSLAPRAGDGLRSPLDSRNRIVRGGAWTGDASSARSANRLYGMPDYRSDDLGVRPARALSRG